MEHPLLPSAAAAVVLPGTAGAAAAPCCLHPAAAGQLEGVLQIPICGSHHLLLLLLHLLLLHCCCCCLCCLFGSAAAGLLATHCGHQEMGTASMADTTQHSTVQYLIQKSTEMPAKSK
jgi:hypothetical protein